MMMRRTTLVCTIIASAVILMFWNQTGSNSKHPDPAQTAAASDPSKQGSQSQTSAATRATGSSTSDPVPRATPADHPTERGAILDMLHDAATMYDAAYLPVIEPYLTHTDPEIRAGAVDAMIILGEAAASPMLRRAASRMTSAADVRMMLEAADYLELPEADITRFLRPGRGGSDPGRSDPPRPPSGP